MGNIHYNPTPSSLQLNYTYLAVFTIFDLFSYIQADKTFNDNVFQNKQIKTYILLS